MAELRRDFLSRYALLWVLLALGAALLPHVERFPLWLSGAALLAIGWRFMLHLGRWPAPPLWLKTLLVLGCLAGIYLTYGRHFAVENMVALLAAGALLKPLEAQRQRDIYVLLCVCLFLLSTEFLFEQSPLYALYVLAAFIFIICALIALHEQDSAPRYTLALAGRLLLQSLPLALIFFVVVPRIGPLWSINIRSESALVGLSESMSPGQFSELSQTDELAFRAEFSGPVPQNQDLYWRALVLDNFDGKTWRASVLDPEVEWYKPGAPQQTARNLVQYKVMLEPHQKNWLFALDLAVPVQADTGITADFRLLNKKPVLNKKIYQVAAQLHAPLDINGINEFERTLDLQIPRHENQQTQALAARLRASTSSDTELLNATQDFFQRSQFTYTLKPPLATEQNSIDQFLFTTRRGYCAHFAGSFVYLMRAAGIPARVVVGYQGGEFNPQGNYLAVYQYSAHAWAEVWLAGEGWRRVDPTAWVAPSRISRGLEASLQDEFMQGKFLSAHRYKHNALLNKLRQGSEALNYYWNNVILSYSAKDQQALFDRLLGQEEYWQVVGMVMAGVALLFILLALYVLKPFQGSAREPVPRLFDQLCAALRKQGLELLEPCSVASVFRHWAQVCPKQAGHIRALQMQYEHWLYKNPARLDKKALAHLRRQQRQLIKKTRG